MSRQAMRFGLTLLAVVAVLLAAAAGQFALAQGLGIAAGALFFLSGATQGGMLGNARRVEHRPADARARLGVLLAAMGLAAGTLGHDPPFPLPLRIILGIALMAAAVAALLLTARAPK